MRLTRRNVVLIGIVVVLGAADFLSRGPARDNGAGGRLLPGLEPDDIAHLRLVRGDERLDLLRLDSGRTGGGWAVEQKERFPAHATLVQELLARITGVSRTDRVSSAVESRDEYGLGQAAGRVELLDGDGATRAVLWIGHPPELERGAYVRLEGEDAVYRAATLPAVDTDPIRWLDTLLVDLDPPLVLAITVESGGAEVFRLSRLADGRWRAVGHSVLLTAQAVDPLLLVASNLYFVDIAPGSSADLETPRTRIVFDLEGGGRREVRLGATDDEGNVRATNPYWREPWAVVLSNSTAARLDLVIARVQAELE
jgi:hypothetical protein